MLIRAILTDIHYFGLLRMMTAARVALLTIVFGLSIGRHQTCLAQGQVYQSIMTRPVGSDGYAPSASASGGSEQRPGLFVAGSENAAPPANSEVLPNPGQPYIPNGPSPDGPQSDDGQVGKIDSRSERMFHGFRTLFGPEPNGNWNSEPVHFDAFLGFLDDRKAQNTGVLGGFRLGWDYDTYWGVETRLGFTSLQEDTGPVVIWDESLLYYPWGDSRVRPYFTLGLGLNEYRIVDADDAHHRQNLVDMPFGIGFKYRLHEWLVLRFDILDNLAFGSGGLGTMNNFSFTTGFEYRFGGTHFSYWPWDPAPAR